MSGFADVIQVRVDGLPVTDDVAACAARCACVAELRAVCAILFGVAALCLTFLTFPWLMSLFVTFLFADGALAILFGCLAALQHKRGMATVLPGMANMVAGATLLLVPAISLTAVATLVGVWAAVTGALDIGAAWHGPGRKGRLILLCIGAASIGWAASLWLMHETLPSALAWWLGVYALALGAMLLALAPRLRTDFT